jgi:DNA repair protein RadA/Sms
VSDTPTDLEEFEPLEDPEDDEPEFSPDGNPLPPKPVMRFQCAGAERKGEDGVPYCKHKATKRWFGPCPACRRWYACKEIKRAAESRMRLNLGETHKVKAMQYLPTGISELDDVLGGGLVAGKTVLLAGEPGAGKTTLVLQIASHFAKPGRHVYVCSGEDDRDSVVHYAQRLGINNPNIDVFGDSKGLQIETVINDARDMRSKLLILDSIQVCEYAGSKADVGQSGQIDAVANFITSFGKSQKVCIIVIGHVNKELEIAGTQKLKHLVDVVLRFDKRPFFDDAGELIEGTEKVREFSLEGKSRQGDETKTALMEMTSKGLMPLSDMIRRKITRLHLV